MLPVGISRVGKSQDKGQGPAGLPLRRLQGSPGAPANLKVPASEPAPFGRLSLSASSGRALRSIVGCGLREYSVRTQRQGQSSTHLKPNPMRAGSYLGTRVARPTLLTCHPLVPRWRCRLGRLADFVVASFLFPLSRIQGSFPMAQVSEPLLKHTIKKNQLRQIVPLADSTIWEMGQRGQFPRRFLLTPRCGVWDLGEVEAWLALHRAKPIARQRRRISASASADPLNPRIETSAARFWYRENRLERPPRLPGVDCV